MEYEFDEAKCAANLAQHGLDFSEAQELWQDGKNLEARHSVGEDVLDYFDTVKAVRRNHEKARINLDLPQWMISSCIQQPVYRHAPGFHPPGYLHLGQFLFFQEPTPVQAQCLFQGAGLDFVQDALSSVTQFRRATPPAIASSGCSRLSRALN